MNNIHGFARPLDKGVFRPVRPQAQLALLEQRDAAGGGMKAAFRTGGHDVGIGNQAGVTGHDIDGGPLYIWEIEPVGVQRLGAVIGGQDDRDAQG